MKKQLLTFLFAFFCSTVFFGQTKYPQDYFRNPLDIPIILAGTFGELRPNHFHSGLDIKTQQREGLKVYAIGDGYVSRIRVATWGLGKALYITHPNGYTSVYAHLSKFNETIENYLKDKQYQSEEFEIQLFPSSSELKVSKSDVVAFSGSTGGFMAPHLHFEIRSTATEKTINAMHFGITPPDSKKPTINSLRAYSFGEKSHVNGSNIDIPISISNRGGGSYKTNTLRAFGTIGFGINCYDMLDGALNKNGIYQLEMQVNGKTFYKHKLETFAFDETRYINILFDYKNFLSTGTYFQRTFVHPSNELSIISKYPERGYINIKDSLDYQVEIIANDFAGNTSTLNIPIKGQAQEAIIYQKEETKTPYFVNHTERNTFKKSGVTVDFYKNTFYDTFYMDFEVENEVVKIHKPNIPVHKDFTITFDVNHLDAETKEKTYIARVVNSKNYSYCSTEKWNTEFKTSTKNLGSYTLRTDKTNPSIYSCSFHDGQNLSNYRFLSIKAHDYQTGIKTFRGEIDGKWILMEFDLKTNKYTYDFNDKKLEPGTHTFTFKVVDNVANENTFTASFQIK